MEHWTARARYKDGTEINTTFKYRAGGDYYKEEEEQYKIECYLIEAHPDCVWYSVDYQEE